MDDKLHYLLLGSCRNVNSIFSTLIYLFFTLHGLGTTIVRPKNKFKIKMPNLKLVDGHGVTRNIIGIVKDIVGGNRYGNGVSQVNGATVNE